MTTAGTVLILDDSLTVRMDLVEAFGAAGWRTEPCATAAQAWELLAREQVDRPHSHRGAEQRADEPGDPRPL